MKTLFSAIGYIIAFVMLVLSMIVKVPLLILLYVFSRREKKGGAKIDKNGDIVGEFWVPVDTKKLEWKND